MSNYIYENIEIIIDNDSDCDSHKGKHKHHKHHKHDKHDDGKKIINEINLITTKHVPETKFFTTNCVGSLALPDSQTYQYNMWIVPPVYNSIKGTLNGSEYIIQENGMYKITTQLTVNENLQCNLYILKNGIVKRTRSSNTGGSVLSSVLLGLNKNDKISVAISVIGGNGSEMTTNDNTSNFFEIIKIA